MQNNLSCCQMNQHIPQLIFALPSEQFSKPPADWSRRETRMYPCLKGFPLYTPVLYSKTQLLVHPKRYPQINLYKLNWYWKTNMVLPFLIIIKKSLILRYLFLTAYSFLGMYLPCVCQPWGSHLIPAALYRIEKDV